MNEREEIEELKKTIGRRNERICEIETDLKDIVWLIEKGATMEELTERVVAINKQY